MQRNFTREKQQMFFSQKALRFIRNKKKKKLKAHTEKMLTPRSKYM